MQGSPLFSFVLLTVAVALTLSYLWLWWRRLNRRKRRSLPILSPDWCDRFEQSLREAQQQLTEVGDRYRQVVRDRHRWETLQEAQEAAHQEGTSARDQLRSLEAQILELQVNLESRLIDWPALKESFWQFLRFGGLGFLLGWFLHWLAR